MKIEKKEELINIGKEINELISDHRLNYNDALSILSSLFIMGCIRADMPLENAIISFIHIWEEIKNSKEVNITH